MPLPANQFGQTEAQHLLRRAGFSATPDTVKQVLGDGLDATLKRWFSKPVAMPVPDETEELVEEAVEMQAMIRRTDDQKKKNMMRRQLREQNKEAYQEYGIRWLQFAGEPRLSVQEKYVMFLQDIFVVGRDAVRGTGYLFKHQNLLRRDGFGSYRDLAKAVSRSPAMIRYLNLDKSYKKAPNENFARELFELFTLGEGNYTEQDIKEAARAFTGYRLGATDFRFAPGQHDGGVKTVFGETGRFDGDDVIDIVYRQPAAHEFVPRELVRFYLTEEPLPGAYTRDLGRAWRMRSFNMSYLLKKFFGSQLFYAPECRGNMIKSPVHYYLGLCQDLNLDVAPFPGPVLGSLRSMGQEFYNPPNVRGWVGGKHWINATTLAARRHLAKRLFDPINEDKLNADDYVELEAARAAGRAEFVVSRERLKTIAREDPDFIVDHFCSYFLPRSPNKDMRAKLVNHLKVPPGEKQHHVKDVILVLLQSPQYQLS